MSLLCFQRDDHYLPQAQTGPASASRAAFLTRALWPLGYTIRIFFIEPIPNDLPWQQPLTTDPTYLDPLYETLQGISNKNLIQPIKGLVDPKTLVRKVVEERIAPLVNLKFTFVDKAEDSDIRILFRKGIGCSSHVGTTRLKLKFSQGEKGNIEPKGQPEPTMTFGWLDVSTVLHEFGHALGMIHEHQNPKGNPIKWNEPAVFCHFKKTNENWTNEIIRTNIIDPYKKDSINGSEFDPASIMIYSFPETVECNKQELPITLNTPPIKVNPNYRLSLMDIEILKQMYPFGERNFENVDKIPFTSTPVYELQDGIRYYIQRLVEFLKVLFKRIYEWLKQLYHKVSS